MNRNKKYKQNIKLELLVNHSISQGGVYLPIVKMEWISLIALIFIFIS